jgi:hypothetical protein
LKWVDPSGLKSKDITKVKENINIIEKWMTWLTAIETLIWMWAVSVFNRDFDYPSRFLGYSLIWATNLEYLEWSEYVNLLKQTSDYQDLLEKIEDKILNWELSSKWSEEALKSTLWTFTLKKYDYSYNTVFKDWYYNIDIIIEDIYDFNKEENNTFLHKYLNVMHKANEYWILTPIEVKININEKIWK